MKMKHFAASVVALAVSAGAAQAAGTLVAVGDEWALSSTAYTGGYQAGTENFVQAITNTFGGSNYLVLTGNTTWIRRVS